MDRMRKSKRQKISLQSELKELASKARNGNVEAERRLRELLVSKRNRLIAKGMLAQKIRFKKFSPTFGNASKAFQGGAPGLGKNS